MKFYLYVKVHRQTRLRYLGYTKRNPFVYRGSGDDWKIHIKKFGNIVDTEVLATTTDQDEIKRFGRYYSTLWNVVGAVDDFGNKIWANIKPETGNGGFVRTSTGKTTVKDSFGNFQRVSVNDPRIASGELTFVRTGKTAVRDSQGVSFSVDKNDPRIASGELTHVNSGRVTVYDSTGNRFTVDKDDSRLKSKELIPTTTGQVTVKDSNGNTFNVAKDDPRYLSGELVHINKGKTTVRDKDGNLFSVSVNDPKFISGELVSVKKGVAITKIFASCVCCHNVFSTHNLTMHHKKCIKESSIT